MRRAIFAAILLAISAAGVFAYYTVSREREYRRLIAEGERAAAADKTFAAIEAFSGAIALKRDSMLPYLRRGEIYRNQGDVRTALRDLRTASRLAPAATRPLEEVGDLNYALGNYERAAVRYAAYTRLDDRSPRVLYKLALARYRLGNIREAIPPLRQSIGLKETAAEAHYLLGLCLRDRRLQAEARAAFVRAIEISRDFTRAHEELADLYRLEGRTADEIGQLEALAELEPDRIERRIALGEAYARSGQIDRAVATLGEAAERVSDPRLFVTLGKVWLDSAEKRADRVALSKALEALQGAVAGGAATSEALTLLGRALLQAHEVELAERVLQQATNHFPVDPSAFLHLADAAERLAQPRATRDALANYQTLVGEDAPQAERRERVARIADLSLRLNEPATAVAWLRRAKMNGLEQADLCERLADAEIRAGAFDDARRTITDGLSKDPRNRTLALLQQRLP